MRVVRTLALALCVAACSDEPTKPVVVPEAHWPSPDVEGAALFVLVDRASVTDSVERSRIEQQLALPQVKSIQVARLVARPDTLLSTQRTIALELAPGRRGVFVGEPPAYQDATGGGWQGWMEGGGYALLRYSAYGVNGTISVPGRGGASYRIAPLGASGLHVIAEIDPSKFGPD